MTKYLTLAIVGLSLAACDDKPGVNKNFAMIGDSVISLMAPVQPQLPSPFDGAINLGVGGQTSTQIRLRIGTIPAGTPMVLLEGGINNLGDPDAIVADYEAMLNTIPSTTQVFFLGIIHVDEAQLAKSIPGSPLTNAAITEVVVRINAICYRHSNCAPAIAAQMQSMDGLTIDGLHPSPAGYLAIANRVLGH